MENSNQDQQHARSSENTDYKREGVQLGATSDAENQNEKVNAGPQHGGGGAGYDAGKETEQIKEEREDMHNERDLDELNVERQQSSTQEAPQRTTEPPATPSPTTPSPATPTTPPAPAKDPGSQNPENTAGGANRSQSGAWSQSSWDPNSSK